MGSLESATAKLSVKQEKTLQPVGLVFDNDESRSVTLNGSLKAVTQTHKERLSEGVEKTFFTVWLDFDLNPKPLQHNTADARGWYVTLYRVRVEPLLANASEQGLLRLSSKPANSNGSVNVTASTSSTLGVDVGVSAQGPSVDFTSTRTEGTSKTYSVKDMKVENRSQTEYAEWVFSMPLATKLGDFDQNLSELKTLQAYNFHPSVAADWCIDGFVKGVIQVKVTLDTVFAMTEIDGPGVTVDSVSAFLSIGNIPRHLSRPELQRAQHASQSFNLFLHIDE